MSKVQEPCNRCWHKLRSSDPIECIACAGPDLFTKNVHYLPAITPKTVGEFLEIADEKAIRALIDMCTKELSKRLTPNEKS